MTLNVHNVHRWLTHTSAITYRSLSQSYQWLSPVTQTKLTKVHFKTLSVVAFVNTPAFPPNLIIQWIEVG